MSRTDGLLRRIKEGEPVILVCSGCGEVVTCNLMRPVVCPACGGAEVSVEALGDDDG